MKAHNALDRKVASAARLHGRLAATANALREATELVRRLCEEGAIVRAQIAERQSELSEMLDDLSLACILTTVDGVILDANTAAGTLLNLSRRGLIGRSLLLFFDDRDKWRALAHKVNASAESTRGCGSLRPRERGRQPVTACIRPCRSSCKLTLRWLVTVQSHTNVLENAVNGITEASTSDEVSRGDNSGLSLA